MKKYGLLLTLSACLCLLKVSATSEKPMSAHTDNPDGERTIVDAGALQGFSSITVYARFPEPSPMKSAEINKIVMQRLKKFGTVIPHQFDVSAPFAKVTAKAFLNNPYLVFEIKNIVNKPMYTASLIFEAPVTIEGNNKYCRSIIWQSDCIMDFTEQRQLQEATRKAFDVLMARFEHDYLEVNKSSPGKPNIYFAEL